VAGGVYENEPVYKGKKVVIWYLAIFFALSILGPLSAIGFSKLLSPYLINKDREAAEQAAIERMEQREGNHPPQQ
jgi:hypothetical protein